MAPPVFLLLLSLITISFAGNSALGSVNEELYTGLCTVYPFSACPEAVLDDAEYRESLNKKISSVNNFDRCETAPASLYRTPEPNRHTVVTATESLFCGYLPPLRI
jgi:hypothetical protein